MVREQFHELLDGDHAWEHGLHQVARRTYEFVEFLDKVLKVDFRKFTLPAGKRSPTTTPATSAASASRTRA